jgi:hypothetical protein
MRKPPFLFFKSTSLSCAKKNLCRAPRKMHLKTNFEYDTFLKVSIFITVQKYVIK